MIQDKQVEERKERRGGDSGQVKQATKRGNNKKGEDTGVASPSMSAWI
jgi:hypothetical protein